MMEQIRISKYLLNKDEKFILTILNHVLRANQKPAEFSHDAYHMVYNIQTLLFTVVYK